MQIIAADDEEEMRGTLLEETECLLDAGCLHPIHKATLDDKSAIVGAVALHHCVLSIKAELDQLKEGLEYTGLLQYIHKFPKAFESVFTSKDACKLTAGKCIRCICKLPMRLYILYRYLLLSFSYRINS